MQFMLLKPRQADGLIHFEPYDRGAMPARTLAWIVRHHSMRALCTTCCMQGSAGPSCTGPWMPWHSTGLQVFCRALHAGLPCLQAVRPQPSCCPAVILDMAERLQELGVATEAIHGEGGPGQFEVSPRSRLGHALHVGAACS